MSGIKENISMEIKVESKIINSSNNKIKKINPKRDIKKFIIKLLIFIILINIPTYVYIEYYHMNFGYIDCPMWKYSRDFIDKKATDGTSDPELLVMGDSRTMAGVRTPLLSDKAQSLCLTGGSTIEIYYMISDYIKRHNAPKAIFCSFTPNHLETHSEFFYRAVNYKFISSMQILEVLNKSRELNDYPYVWKKPIADNYYLESLLFRMNFVLYYKAELAAGKYYKRKDANWKVYNNLKAGKGYLNFSGGPYSDGLNEEARTPVFKPSPLLIYYLDKIFEICSKNNIRIIYQAMPMNEASHNALTKEYVDGYVDLMKKMKGKYPTATINSEILKYKNNCFGDCSHMNSDGAEKMTNYIKEKYFKTGI